MIDLRSRATAAPHLSCVASTRDELRAIATGVQDGIRHLVALRGDLPSGTATSGEFRYANELVEFIREEFGSHFFIEVAAIPNTIRRRASAQDELEAFKRKVEAGADSAITQYFFNADAYFQLRRCLRSDGDRRPDRSGHHADRPLLPACAFLRRVRRRDPALDTQEAGRLRRRPRPSAPSGSTS